MERGGGGGGGGVEGGKAGKKVKSFLHSCAVSLYYSYSE